MHIMKSNFLFVMSVYLSICALKVVRFLSNLVLGIVTKSVAQFHCSPPLLQKDIVGTLLNSYRSDTHCSCMQ
jgi:hypothetical protein